MKTATKQDTLSERLNDGDWLYRLLDDVRREIIREPSGLTVQRIRGRLLAQIETPAKAAA